MALSLVGMRTSIREKLDKWPKFGWISGCFQEKELLMKDTSVRGWSTWELQKVLWGKETKEGAYKEEER